MDKLFSTSVEEEIQLSIKDLLGFMVDIGRAGDYLESQRHVYRGLSAKTCYVNNDHGHRIVKLGSEAFWSFELPCPLGDFGLVRGVFSDKYILIDNPDFQPIRWCSPEVASNLQFSSKSDVWAFGVVLFEIMTQGSVPYSQCTTVEQVRLVLYLYVNEFRCNLAYEQGKHLLNLEVAQSRCEGTKFYLNNCNLQLEIDEIVLDT